MSEKRKRETRKKGNYTVCHPYRMSKEVIGYWDGKWWRFEDTGNDEFDDDDLNWIDERKLKGG